MGGGEMAIVCPHCYEPASSGLQLLGVGEGGEWTCDECGEPYDDPVMFPIDELGLMRRVRELEPWRHDIDLGPFSTFDVAESKGIYQDFDHPTNRIEVIQRYYPPLRGSALDVGCGPGGISLALEDDGWSVVGIDNSEREIERATFAAEQLDVDVAFDQRDMWSFLPKPKAFDLVVCVGVLYHAFETAPSDHSSAVEAEKDLVDRLLETASYSVLIETNPREWLADHVRDRGWRVIADLPVEISPYGNRHVLAALSPGANEVINP